MMHFNFILLFSILLCSNYYSDFIFEKPSRTVDRVFIHCSDSDWKHHDDISVIRKWHMDENGWDDVGYHFFIKRNGTIQKGRSLELTPSAQKRNNVRTIAICLHGREKFTKKQFESLKKLCLEIHKSYQGKVTFHGHREVAREKTCPNFDYVKVLNLDGHGRMKGIENEHLCDETKNR